MQAWEQTPHRKAPAGSKPEPCCDDAIVQTTASHFIYIKEVSHELFVFLLITK